jgi:dihydropyrimidine dehydrogenase (NAD+) subunit PreA
LTLASPEGALNGDPRDYRAAVELLASGAQAVSVDGLVRSHGLGIVNELHGGFSWFLAERGLRSVSELVGSARARPSTPLGELPAGNGVCEVDAALCTHCGNCSRCPYLAIALDPRGIPVVDATRCTGCALCVEECFVGALAIRAV